MTLTLYHYVHCPFCIRVRMALGCLELAYNSQVLAYDDEMTPVKLTGKKMLPILTHDQGWINESLDIINYLDKSDKLKSRTLSLLELETRLNTIGTLVHSLAMPYWIYTPEFNERSRTYFQSKKEEKRGPFRDLVKIQPQLMKQVAIELQKLIPKFEPFFESTELTIKDIMLASHLWGLYVVPEFQFDPQVHAYLQEVKRLCQFNYHQDFW